VDGKKNPHAVALGRVGGKKGGVARAAKLTPDERKAIASHAAIVRWTRKGEGNSGEASEFKG
jgi:hypothetical protein